MVVTFLMEKEFFRSGVHLRVQNTALLCITIVNFLQFLAGKVQFALHQYCLSLSWYPVEVTTERVKKCFLDFNYVHLPFIKEIGFFIFH